MKHIALLKSRTGNHGGLEKYARRIAAGFVEKGAEVTILTTSSQEVATDLSGYRFERIRTAPWPAFVRMEQFDRFTRKWALRNKPDIVFGMDRNRVQTHIRAGNGVHAAYLESRAYAEGKWKAWSCQFNPLHRKIIELEQAAFENPNLQKLFTNSKMVRNQILERYRVDPEKIEVIHNGVEWQEMERDYKTWKEHKNSEYFYFLFIGNGYLRKGLKQLLQALAILQNPDVQLLVIGKEKNMARFIHLAKRLGISSQIHFLGPQANVRPFYQLADALIIPSFYDPFANVTVEALAMGLFVVSSSFNGGAEILSSENGVLIENLLDPASLAASLQTALRHPKTSQSAEKIRLSVKWLDFSHQMNRLIEATLG